MQLFLLSTMLEALNSQEITMNLKSMDLAWIVVNDLQKAVKFYTETVGLKLLKMEEKWGWAELAGPNGGARIGIAQTSPQSPDNVKPGENAVMTFTVVDIEQAIADLVKKGTKLEGGLQEVPGHVKLQTVVDTDGNRFQLAQLLHSK